MPSMVDVYVFFCTSCTAQSAGAAMRGAAMQYDASLPAKKTSRQHAVTPSSAVCAGVRVVVVRARREKSTVDVGIFCDCSRTRTTSRGVTGVVHVNTGGQSSDFLGEVTN